MDDRADFLRVSGAWGTPAEVERRRRILLALWAYAYECGDPLVEDAEYDSEWDWMLWPRWAVASGWPRRIAEIA